MAEKKATKKADGEAAVLAKIAAMPEPYRALGERLHAIILRSAPALRPVLWYGMPGYAKDGPCLCFFRLDKHLTFGLTEEASFVLDEGAPHRLMECAWFFKEMDAATEAKLAAIVRQAAG
ncbi:MAG: DUF1801 domain-containing protein [Gemmataceae bacterium]|nr:DUF1801 domain-containing protein [Gemmataceae bacterium]